MCLDILTLNPCVWYRHRQLGTAHRPGSGASSNSIARIRESWHTLSPIPPHWPPGEKIQPLLFLETVHSCVVTSVVPYNAHSWLLADQPICTSRLEQVCFLETCELRVCPIAALFGSCIVGTDVQQTQSRNHKRLRDGFESGGCPRTSGVWKLLPVFSLSK